MMSRFKQLANGQIIAFHQGIFTACFQVARKQEMSFAIRNHCANGIIIFVACACFIIFLIQDIQRNFVAELIASLRAVCVIPTFKCRIMYCPCRHFRITPSDIIFRNLRACNFPSEIYNGLAHKIGKYAVRPIFADKCRNMVLVRMRSDNVFYYTVRTILLKIRNENRRRPTR